MEGNYKLNNNKNNIDSNDDKDNNINNNNDKGNATENDNGNFMKMMTIKNNDNIIIYR